jgi:hypothetical protein
LTLTQDEIVELINDYDKQTRAIRREALKMSWYMRGGLSFEDAMHLSNQDREIIADIIKENMETTKKSGLPFF